MTGPNIIDAVDAVDPTPAVSGPSRWTFSAGACSVCWPGRASHRARSAPGARGCAMRAKLNNLEVYPMMNRTGLAG